MIDEDISVIKDSCRQNLNRYTLRAFSLIPSVDRPLILDAGCGTGVPSLAVIEECNGIIYAVDTDLPSIKRFRKRVEELDLDDRIRIFHDSILKQGLFTFHFDIILAEGLLNVTGFERGLDVLSGYLKAGGYMLIHDELKNDSGKRKYFKENNLELTGTFVLDEKVWWNEYFACLESSIKKLAPDKSVQEEMEEIDRCRRNPEENRSVYYILKKAC